MAAHRAELCRRGTEGGAVGGAENGTLTECLEDGAVRGAPYATPPTGGKQVGDPLGIGGTVADGRGDLPEGVPRKERRRHSGADGVTEGAKGMLSQKKRKRKDLVREGEAFVLDR